MDERTKKFLFLGFFVAIFTFCTFMLTENTFAHPITNAIVTDFENTTWNGVYNTYFDVSISYDSTNYTCSVTDRFHCIDASDWYLKPSYSTTFSVNDKGSGNYEITIKYNGVWLGNDIQRARGTVHCDSKKVSLTAYAVIAYRSSDGAHKYLKTNGTVTDWLATAPADAYTEVAEVTKGTKAEVVVDSAKGNYEFDEWGSSCGDESGETADNTNRKCTVNQLNGKKNVYAYFKLKQFTLTAYAVTEYKTENNKGYHKYLKTDGTVTDWLATAPADAWKKQSTVAYGSSATVDTSSFNPANYSWGDWGSSCATSERNGRKCTRSSLTQDGNVYAYYTKNKFKGQASVTSGGKTQTTGFVNVDKKGNNAALLKVDCPESGCSASFALSLMPEAGTGETTYTIYKNGKQKVGYIGKVVTPATAGTSVGTFTVNMQAGDLVCYKMTFSAVPVEGKKATVEACAAAEADKDSDISIELRDQDSSADYWDWREDYVYAKPNDMVELHGAFEPRYQYLANKSSSVTSIILDEDNGTSKSGLNNNGEPILGVFNNNMNPSWNNAFSITVKGECKDTFSPFDYENRVGNTGSYDGNYNYSVATYDMGKIEAKSKTNNCDVAKNTPKGASLIYNTSNRRFEATVNNSSIDDVVSIYVPYNFQNETKVTTEENRIVNAGESDDFDIAVETYPRANPLTNGTYATTFNNAKLKVRLCNENETSCYGEEEVDISGLNIGKTYSTQMIAENARIKLNIPDIDAGSMVCLRSMMYPADSGSYDNWQNSEGSATWTDWSDKKCFKVAKRPSLQVWGGSVYSAGMIDMMPSAKNNLYGYEDNYLYKMIGQGEHRVFGSWAELSLAANGDVNGLASGAGTGYARTENARTVGALDPTLENLGGSAEGINVNYCLRSTLSFANTSCDKIVGGLGGGLQSEVSSSKRALVSRFVDENSKGYTLEKTSEINDGYLRSYSGDMETGEDGVEKKKTTRVIVSEGDVTINGDITYLDNGYSNLEDVPKIIIYAKNDINIACEVVQIDAILIAENNINTCSDSDDINAEMNSKQLKINGSVISNTLTLNRTYGAAKGVNSVIPAEIVNYDTSLYLWANKQADVTTSGKLTEAYISELAPRY